MVFAARLKNLSRIIARGGLSEYLKKASMDEAAYNKVYRMCPQFGSKHEKNQTLGEGAEGRMPILFGCASRAKTGADCKFVNQKIWINPNLVEFVSALEGIIPDQENGAGQNEDRQAWREFRAHVAFVITAILSQQGINDPTDEQITAVYVAMDVPSLWEEWNATQ